jgi:hypothetical protein
MTALTDTTRNMHEPSWHGQGVPCHHCIGWDEATLSIRPDTTERIEPLSAEELDAQFEAIDKSLLSTFQWSNKEYERHGLAAHVLLQRLNEIGWTVSRLDRDRSAANERLAVAFSAGYKSGLENEVDDWNATVETITRYGVEYAAALAKPKCSHIDGCSDDCELYVSPS